MKKIILITILITLTFLVGCDPNAGKRPTDQDGTFWVSENLQGYFIVDEVLDHYNIGFLFDINPQKIKLTFSPGFGVDIVDANKDHYSEPNTWVLKGDCKFRKKKLTITITETKIDSVKVDDKIIFNRVDELPEWALDLEAERIKESVTVYETETG